MGKVREWEKDGEWDKLKNSIKDGLIEWFVNN